MVRTFCRQIQWCTTPVSACACNVFYVFPLRKRSSNFSPAVESRMLPGRGGGCPMSYSGCQWLYLGDCSGRDSLLTSIRLTAAARPVSCWSLPPTHHCHSFTFFFLSQLATIEPGKKFHMYCKEELEEVIKDIWASSLTKITRADWTTAAVFPVFVFFI